MAAQRRGSVNVLVQPPKDSLDAIATLPPGEKHAERLLRIPAGTGITLRHLAGHTAALPRVPPRLRRLDPYADFDLEALNVVLERLDTFTTGPPGGEAEYSNLGYAVLGAALSAAADAPYEELLNRHVLTPLSITEVTSNPPPAGQLSGRRFLGRPLCPWNMSGVILPAGGMWATPRATGDQAARRTKAGRTRTDLEDVRAPALALRRYPGCLRFRGCLG
ncbi:serine hydrolase [Streptomyces sp. NPDC056323]|uniref:serine hydrolase n=1 Tax=Streptomyces sp. NPDC056323 TaxID=3345784 RepID=UPI0035E1846E